MTAQVIPLHPNAEKEGFAYIVCGACGGRDFVVVLGVRPAGHYDITGLQCSECGNTIHLGDRQCAGG